MEESSPVWRLDPENQLGSNMESNWNFYNSWNSFLRTHHSAPPSHTHFSLANRRSNPPQMDLFESASIAFQDLFEGEEGFIRNVSSKLLFTHQIRNSTLFTVSISGTDVSASPKISPHKDMVFVYDPSNDAQLLDVDGGNVGNMPDPNAELHHGPIVYPAFSVHTWILMIGKMWKPKRSDDSLSFARSEGNSGNVGNPPERNPGTLANVVSSIKSNCGHVKRELVKMATTHNPMLSLLQIVVSVVDYGVTGFVRVWY